jgi:hypothetical protein
MLVTKIVTLIVYAILAWVAISLPLTLWSQLAIGFLVLLALAHIVECFMYRKLMREAPGEFGWHLANVLLFGVVHKLAMEEALENVFEEQV